MTELIAAIDLINGKVVRLFKGDYKQKQVYTYDALTKLKEYEQAGAKWLHIVDLTGAKEPAKRQLDLIKKLTATLNANLQVGGGIRTKAEVKALLDSGVKRIVIGSLAVKNKELCLELFKEFSNETLTLALDIQPFENDYFVAVNAWQEKSNERLFDLLEFYAKQGLKHLLCTDISRDGTMQGANIELYKHIKSKFSEIQIQASGGVSKLNDLKALKASCSGVIVGKALLDGVFSISEGIACLQNA
ncbi:1-(5-phosphoribosyl)-5-[(5-phosphoribosylamino)methylideneamino]imidazole-4-carboxamide isomerase [Campylobacter sp. MIT 97-5078]|uniref:1-(5-phosphoribosyl)-5-[(5- phosphoribosylamino)methylideneamino]imidazole-4- carboxamide isomerase n=1 Tax=Campylobacter sp. MIT 97-5078 TaxID=1548153 RepID=UPI00051394F8|nr:1-(5-phosphoribosyl)-5-[(5-phosphoribosylamino)methylideneamino]imidazole-4-carboxamide isomerase [Campylobacter sp. MIT 97-5078]KGI55483.1 1-(5-phosphoribosyl)-5-[(5-phosphoribosylamino)methylideneamino] imidazole-4-carboxamide isomerase [Campylobacter sp. MIT 97-5078]TQR27903.1 1-(5-phosphoribosyl)-5-[(5-phosphoribosylamino)methylideneamino]imidazole-4-carboxamide isomerase [Campylobacter sp. MIT 97-5078]